MVGPDMDDLSFQILGAMKVLNLATGDSGFRPGFISDPLARRYGQSRVVRHREAQSPTINERLS